MAKNEYGGLLLLGGLGVIGYLLYKAGVFGQVFDNFGGGGSGGGGDQQQPLIPVITPLPPPMWSVDPNTQLVKTPPMNNPLYATMPTPENRYTRPKTYNVITPQGAISTYSRSDPTDTQATSKFPWKPYTPQGSWSFQVVPEPLIQRGVKPQTVSLVQLPFKTMHMNLMQKLTDVTPPTRPPMKAPKTVTLYTLLKR